MTHAYRFAALALTLCLLCPGAWTQEETASDNALEFILSPVHEGFSVYTGWHEAEVAYRKEPAYAGTAVRRGAIRFGVDRSDFIGLAYDVTANRLYIDRNRNLDLTDDGPPVPGDEDSGPGRQAFSNVTIELTHGAIPVQYTLDIIFTRYSMYFMVRSGWKGEIEIRGKSRVMGIADDLDGLFDASDSFRFHHERHDEARLPYGGMNEMQLPKWLHFEGQSYFIEPAFHVQDNATALAVTLTPVTDDVMDIAYKGQFVSRVQLLEHKEDRFALGLLDWPTGAMRIPRGVYSPYRVDLLDSFYGYPQGVARLDPDGITTLQTGGPIRQEISVRRTGARLNLGYALRGVDKTAYRPVQAHQNPPRFAVYRGNRRVGAGQFEYG